MYFKDDTELTCVSTDLQPINYVYYSGSTPIVVNYFEAGTSGSFDVYEDLQNITLMMVGAGGHGGDNGAGGAGGFILSSSEAGKSLYRIGDDWEKNTESITLTQGSYTWRVGEANASASLGDTTFGSFTAYKGGYQWVDLSAPDPKPGLEKNGGSGAQPNGSALTPYNQGYDGGSAGGGGAANSGSFAGGGDGVFHPWFRGTLGQTPFQKFGADDRGQIGGCFAGGGGSTTLGTTRGLGGGGDLNSDGVDSSGGGAGLVGATGYPARGYTRGGTGGIWLAYPISQYCPTIENLPTGSTSFRMRVYNDTPYNDNPMYVQYQPYGSASYHGFELSSRTDFPLDVCIESGSEFFAIGQTGNYRVVEVGDCNTTTSSYDICTEITFSAGGTGGVASYYECGTGQVPGYDRAGVTERFLSGSEVFVACTISGSYRAITGAGSSITVGGSC
jgi:hypothetical protein